MSSAVHVCLSVVVNDGVVALFSFATCIARKTPSCRLNRARMKLMAEESNNHASRNTFSERVHLRGSAPDQTHALCCSWCQFTRRGWCQSVELGSMLSSISPTYLIFVLPAIFVAVGEPWTDWIACPWVVQQSIQIQVSGAIVWSHANSRAKSIQIS